MSDTKTMSYNDLTTVRLSGDQDRDVCSLTGDITRPPVAPPARRPKPAEEESALPAQLQRALAFLLREDVLRDLILARCSKGNELVAEELRGAGGRNFAGVAWRGKLGFIPDAARQRESILRERNAAALQERLQKPDLRLSGSVEQRAAIQARIDAMQKEHAEALDEMLARPFEPIHIGWWHNAMAPVFKCEHSDVTLQGRAWSIDVELALHEEDIPAAARRLLQAKQWSEPDVSVLFLGRSGIDAQRMETISNAGVIIASMRDSFWEEERHAQRKAGKVIPAAV